MDFKEEVDKFILDKLLFFISRLIYDNIFIIRKIFFMF